MSLLLKLTNEGQISQEYLNILKEKTAIVAKGKLSNEDKKKILALGNQYNKLLSEDLEKGTFQEISNDAEITELEKGIKEVTVVLNELKAKLKDAKGKSAGNVFDELQKALNAATKKGLPASFKEEPLHSEMKKKFSAMSKGVKTLKELVEATVEAINSFKGFTAKVIYCLDVKLDNMKDAKNLGILFQIQVNNVFYAQDGKMTFAYNAKGAALKNFNDFSNIVPSTMMTRIFSKAVVDLFLKDDLPEMTEEAVEKIINNRFSELLEDDEIELDFENESSDEDEEFDDMLNDVLGSEEDIELEADEE